ncbi:MAG TPA: response regulator transcription factor [Solirubrobacteraceae bacterium]|nr:response regulator transcription factor [Solirubrobacteraceae bacterium]
MDPSIPPADRGRPAHPTLLIADDDPVVRSALSMALEHQFQIIGAVADSEAAVEAARRAQPEVALVDVQMPGGGGRSAVKGIAEVSPETAVVVLSGDESDAVVRELMIAGAMTYVRKGIAPHQLADVLHRSIRARTVCETAAD